VTRCQDVRVGTNAGYHLHRRRREIPCDACRIAHTRSTNAQSRALWKLKQHHRGEWEWLLASERKAAGL
jgi:hypothetical protein